MQIKLKFLALAAAGAVGGMTTSAHAVIFTYTGNTTGAPTFNRPLEDLTSLSAVGTAVRYNAFLFTVNLGGSYTFLTTTASFDPFAILYAGNFNPATPLVNGVIANDDLLGFTTSGFEVTLTAGTQYAHVVTGFENTDFGAFSTTIGGPGVVTQVPEPTALALLLAGLGAVGVMSMARRRERETAEA